MLEPRLVPPKRPRPLHSRLGWLALYWLGGVAALAAIAGVIRWVL